MKYIHLIYIKQFEVLTNESYKSIIYILGGPMLTTSTHTTQYNDYYYVTM